MNWLAENVVQGFDGSRPEKIVMDSGMFLNASMVIAKQQSHLSINQQRTLQFQVRKTRLVLPKQNFYTSNGSLGQKLRNGLNAKRLKTLGLWATKRKQSWKELTQTLT